MYRSFTERVLGGVCGGFSARFGVNVWLLRALVIVLSIISGGAVALLYVMLWWAMPQESLLIPQREGVLGVLVALLLMVLVGVAWVGRDAGWLRGPAGQDLFTPVLLLLLSVIFFLKQVRA